MRALAPEVFAFLPGADLFRSLFSRAAQAAPEESFSLSSGGKLSGRDFRAGCAVAGAKAQFSFFLRPD
jgi:hypothetical protein